MTIYRIDTPSDITRVWDKDGDLWEFSEESYLWEFDGPSFSCDWGALLFQFGPVSDKPPLSVGGRFENNADNDRLFVEGTVIVGDNGTAYQLGLGAWYSTHTGDKYKQLTDIPIEVGAVIYVPKEGVFPLN